MGKPVETKAPGKLKLALHSDEDVKKHFNEEWQDAHYVLQCLEEAINWGLHYEFMDGFIGYLKSGSSPRQAAYAAMYDWDM